MTNQEITNSIKRRIKNLYFISCEGCNEKEKTIYQYGVILCCKNCLVGILKREYGNND